MKALAKLDDFKALVGAGPHASDWVLVEQAVVTQFGVLTRDKQWIHMDAERARKDSPFGTTIAHGFLTLAMLSQFFAGCFSFPNRKAGLNYGLDKVRFTSPVRTGDQIRGTFALESTQDISDTELECRWNATVEIKGREKPAVIAAWILRVTY